MQPTPDRSNRAARSQGKDARMTQYGTFLAVGAGVVLLTGLGAAGAARGQHKEQDTFDNTIAVQQAFSRARAYLLQRRPAEAVAVLEADLPRINGDRNYLMLLRE